MPRRPTAIERDIPLFLVPHVVLREVRTHGEELERLNVDRTRSHFYNVSISTRSIKRELKRIKKYPSGTPEADTRVDGEDTGGEEAGWIRGAGKTGMRGYDTGTTAPSGSAGSPCSGINERDCWG